MKCSFAFIDKKVRDKTVEVALGRQLNSPVSALAHRKRDLKQLDLKKTREREGEQKKKKKESAESSNSLKSHCRF